MTNTKLWIWPKIKQICNKYYNNDERLSIVYTDYFNFGDFSKEVGRRDFDRNFSIKVAVAKVCQMGTLNSSWW